ncbi:MAG: serine hydrolase [Candidatus Spyradocola sp.]|nr:serine hydrolase [Candidatus Spyradocola sp.]
MPDLSSWEAQLAALPGRAGVYWKNLVTGEEFCHGADEAYTAASVIKLPVLCAVARQVQQGRADWSERLVCAKKERVPPCGALWYFDGEPEVSLRTLCALMVVISDNTATNLLLRRFGLEGLNDDFRALGLARTHLERLLFDEEAARAGKQNAFTPREMGQLLERIRREAQQGQVWAQFCLELLFEQQINHKIPGYLPEGARVAHKTGEGAGITHDVGLVDAPQPFVLCFAYCGPDVPAAERWVREASLRAWQLCGGTVERML